MHHTEPGGGAPSPPFSVRLLLREGGSYWSLPNNGKRLLFDYPGSPVKEQAYIFRASYSIFMYLIFLYYD